jgi:hypothetical protein
MSVERTPTYPIEIYCDAGISPASMQSPTNSQLQPTLVGRIVILAPDLNYGFIEQIREGILTKKGHPSSDLLERVAVVRAKGICERKELSNFVIYTDSISAAKAAGVQEARWLESGRLQLASLLLQRVVDRASYLRRSARKVISRAPLNEVQKDVFRLFNAEKLEFELSKSALWNRIQTEIATARGSGQERLET